MEIFKGYLFGHLVHPMLVHFPTALFFSAWVFDMVGFFLIDHTFSHASLYCLAMGIGIGFLAAVFGVIDYLKLADREKVFTKASWHAGIQLLVLMGFAVLFGIRINAFPEIGLATKLELAVAGLLVLLMLAGNYIGGDLVFRHGVGVEESGPDTL